MFVVFRADAYFSMGGEVLLYFIVRVEVIKIQIWIEFKLVWNLEKIWKFKRPFPVFIWPSAEFDPAGPVEPTPASHAHGPGAAQHRSLPTPRRVITETETPPAEISTKSNEISNPSQIWELGDRALHVHEIINPKPL
jgi:hypothetical protein